MTVSLIVAASRNGVIGNKNKLPWHLPADLKRFKQLTLGRPILMGRKTFESIGKPLPGRTNIVITRQPGLQACGASVAHSLEEALRLCEGQEEVFVIGGASIYKQSISFADKLYITRVHASPEGDTSFPEIKDVDWKMISSEDHSKDEKNEYDYSFTIYERRH